MNEELFTTDLERLTSVLATNLYDDPFVPIREVLQNASDACLIRQGFSTFDVGRITVSVNKKPGERYIEVLDNGCGMTKDELTSVLSRIASSNKVHKRQKLIDLGFEGASAIAGKFGLGILSCFIVSKRVEILTRSMERNSPTFKWESKGDGKYYWDLVRQAMDIGTRIRLYLKDDAYLDRLLDQRELQSVITHHCRFVRIPIYFGRTGFPLNSSVAPWEPTCPDDDVEDFIRSHFDRDALYHFRFSHEGDVVPGFRSL